MNDSELMFVNAPICTESDVEEFHAILMNLLARTCGDQSKCVRIGMLCATKLMHQQNSSMQIMSFFRKLNWTVLELLYPKLSTKSILISLYAYAAVELWIDVVSLDKCSLIWKPYYLAKIVLRPIVYTFCVVKTGRFVSKAIVNCVNSSTVCSGITIALAHYKAVFLIR